MASVLDSSEIELPCEKCGHKTKKTIGWIKRKTQFTCKCGTVIHLDVSQLDREIAKVDRVFVGMINTVKKINK